MVTPAPVEPPSPEALCSPSTPPAPATGTGSVTTAATTVLGGNGIIAPGSANAVTTNGTLQVGGTSPTTGEDLQISMNGATLTINEKVAFDLFTGQGSGVLNGASDADRLLLTGTHQRSRDLGGCLQFGRQYFHHFRLDGRICLALFDWASLMPAGTLLT